MSPEPLRGPDFSSYEATDVGWLLTDISHHELESTGREREAEIQGRGHYSESLPVEYEPTSAYMAIVERVMHETAPMVAACVARVGDQIVARSRRLQRGIVLVSLARAGTPAGILISRWIRAEYGLDVEHYTMSIILDRGLDSVALDYLSRHHDPRDVVFVDGWTGKGSISRELRRSLRELGERGKGFPAFLAVVADPSGSADIRGTAADVVIASACLNSTVSGLVSRTVANNRILAPTDFHGAKFYRDGIRNDVSRLFLDVVEAEFGPLTRDGRTRKEDPLGAGGYSPGRVRRTVKRLAVEHDVTPTSLIKPGVCETTRVLLRRRPRLVVVRDLTHPWVEHILRLAHERAVPVIEDPGLELQSVGVIEAVRA